jgi:hypothetical protein
MLNKKMLGTVVAFCLSLVATGLMAQADPAKNPRKNVPALLHEANSSYAEKDYAAFRNAMAELHRLRPYNSDYMYQLVIAHALLNEKTPAYNIMLRMQKQGLSYDFSEAEGSENIRVTEVFEYLNELMVLAGEPMGESEVVFTLPESVKMPQAMTWDESRGKFLIGTQSDGRILAVGTDGEMEELIKANNDNGLWSVMGLLVDAPNNRLWVTSAALPVFHTYGPADKGRSSLFEFDLASLELLESHPVPVDGKAHILGNMVLSPAGDLFIVDQNLPLIYKKAAGESKLKPVLALRKMVSLRGIAMNEAGSLMYVADREMGIAVVDVKSGRVGSLVVEETLNLGGIDGLYLKNNRLVVIQNGIKPQRVMLLQLDSTGIQVAGVVPMAVAQPGFDYPTFGALSGEDLFYFGNSHWPGAAEPQKAVSVLRSPLNSGKELVQPDVRRFLEKQAEAQRKEDQLKAQESQDDS